MFNLNQFNAAVEDVLKRLKKKSNEKIILLALAQILRHVETGSRTVDDAALISELDRRANK